MSHKRGYALAQLASQSTKIRIMACHSRIRQIKTSLSLGPSLRKVIVASPTVVKLRKCLVLESIPHCWWYNAFKILVYDNYKQLPHCTTLIFESLWERQQSDGYNASKFLLSIVSVSHYVNYFSWQMLVPEKLYKYFYTSWCAYDQHYQQASIL